MTPDERAELSNLGLRLAEWIEDRDPRVWLTSGIVRRLAVEVRLGGVPADADVCPRCGAPIAQPATGRRRRFCSDRCRVAEAQSSKRHRKRSLAERREEADHVRGTKTRP